MDKSITFLLSGSGKNPVGGFKIVYEYANRLSQRGWNVTVVHPALLWPSRLTVYWKIRNLLGWIKHSSAKSYRPVSWFKLDPKVKILWVPTLNSIFIPPADVVVACPAESAFYASKYPASKGKKFYFIQHFEDWALSKKEVIETWLLPLKKIVIAKWLQKIAENLNESAIYIPNGLDFSFFMKLRPFQERKPQSICFMYHELEFKGTKFMLEAADRIKNKFPDTTFSAFSVYKRPADWPTFIEFCYQPTQEKLRDIFNASRIFISPSIAEGWPLPPAEAMLCGCIVIATDIGGHQEYIDDMKNALLCKSASPESIADKIEYVFNHPEIAESIAYKAPESLKKFDWDSRVELFEKSILS